MDYQVLQSPPPAQHSALDPEVIRQRLETALAGSDAAIAEAAAEAPLTLTALRESSLAHHVQTALFMGFYRLAERVAQHTFQAIRTTKLPIPRRLRQKVRLSHELLEALILNGQALNRELLESPKGPRDDLGTVLAILTRAIELHIYISHRVSTPVTAGIWLHLHAIYRLARTQELLQAKAPEQTQTLGEHYVATLLAGIAQPAAFSSQEHRFIADYIAQNTASVTIATSPVGMARGVYWINPHHDHPAYALIRLQPEPGSEAYYFSCERLARDTKARLRVLESGLTAQALHLPAFADTAGGRSTLRRLAVHWGTPAKRKYPRRRQSYRLRLCARLSQVRTILLDANHGVEFSEWMVTNESPEGFGLMHIAGATTQLRIGDIVAIQAIDDAGLATRQWQICMVRWATSENPEHVELGLQQIASDAEPIEAIIGNETTPTRHGGLLLAPAPPLRTKPTLILPPVLERAYPIKAVVVGGNNNLAIREVALTGLFEQTEHFEIFNVEAVEKP